jgi:DNA-binding PadR family transcriptional regulator
MSLKHGLLGLLNYEPMTGYELDKEFNETLGYFWQARGNQIYRELDTMEKNGWLTSERVIQTEKPNKRVYSITEKGKTEFMEWLSLPETDINNAMNVKSVFLLRVFFAGETGKEQALELLRSYRDVCIARNNELNEPFKKVEKEEVYFPKQAVFWKLTALYGEIITKARLEWVKKSIAMLENMEDI